MKKLPIVVLKECLYVGASLYSLDVPSGFDGRAGFDVNTNHIFPQGVLTAITLVGGGLGNGRIRSQSQFLSRGLSSAQWPSLPYWG